MDCIDPNLRAAIAKKTREDLDLENPAVNSQGWLVLGGKVAQPQALGMVLTEKEHLPPRKWAARDSGLEAWRQRHDDCKPGPMERKRVAGRIKSLKDGYGVVLDSIFPLPLEHELAPRPQERRQVCTWLRDKRREEDAKCPDLESQLVLWVKSALCIWSGAYTETRSGDSAGLIDHSRRSRSQDS